MALAGVGRSQGKAVKEFYEVLEELETRGSRI